MIAHTLQQRPIERIKQQSVRIKIRKRQTILTLELCQLHRKRRLLPSRGHVRMTVHRALAENQRFAMARAVSFGSYFNEILMLSLCLAIQKRKHHLIAVTAQDRI